MRRAGGDGQRQDGSRQPGSINLHGVAISPDSRFAYVVHSTGLVTAVFEESFTYHHDYKPGKFAAVDTNVAVAVGARLCAELAKQLGMDEDADRDRAAFDAMAAAINDVLWNEEHGCYLNWLVKEQQHRPILANHMFDTLRFGIAPPERRQRLYTRLFDPVQFGWGRLGLTTVARQDPKFEVAVGPYDGRAWNGDIWTIARQGPDAFRHHRPPHKGRPGHGCGQNRCGAWGVSVGLCKRGPYTPQRQWRCREHAWLENRAP